jgi:hypothetical protein
MSSAGQSASENRQDVLVPLFTKGENRLFRPPLSAVSAFPLFLFLLGRRSLYFSAEKEGDMASETNQLSDDKTIEKAVWHYVGVGVLWTSLFLTGMAFERLGLTSSILAGILPGETGSLRTQATECQRNFAQMKSERDLLKKQEDTLQAQIKTLRAKVGTDVQ